VHRRRNSVDAEAVSPPTPDDHVRGATHARVVIIEYGDYDCPHTRKAEAVVDRLLADNRDVQVVFRHFPLRDMHANADALARAAEAAALQDKFWELHDRLTRHREPVDDEALESDVREAGVDFERLRRDARGQAVRARVERDVQSGRAAGVHSTPSFFFNGVLHDGHYDIDTLLDRLGAARR
jgi:protein-disulfide isomerase